MLKASIVVPVYKVEKYIDECIESIVKQTYNEWELIVVDDGSPDNSGAAADAWAARDSRIKVFHTENRGPSMARNYGIKQCTGDMIFFIDSDDYVSERYLEAIIKAEEESGADVVMCSSVSVFKDAEVHACHLPSESKYMNGSEYLRQFLSWLGAWAVVWNKGYRRELLSDVSFREGVICEDTYFTNDIAKRAGKIYYIPECLYFYRMKKSSMMHANFVKLGCGIAASVEYCMNENRNQAQIYPLALKLYLNTLLDYYADMPGDKRREWSRVIDRYTRELLARADISRKVKLKFTVAKHCKLLYSSYKRRKSNSGIKGYNYFE